MVVGRHAPAQKQMGHAGALVGSARESADAKLEALAAAGCRIAKGLEEAVTMAAATRRIALDPRHLENVVDDGVIAAITEPPIGRMRAMSIMPSTITASSICTLTTSPITIS